MSPRANPITDKAERHRDILDAAEALLREASDQSINMADVAQRAGIAKGTVYLYFASKEELLLALHERHVLDFFDAMDARLESSDAVSSEDLLKVIQSHVMDILGRGIPLDVSFAFKQRLAQRIGTTGALIEKRFELHPKREGVALLMHTNALVLGLWQMLRPLPELDALYAKNQFTFFKRDFFAEFAVSFRALWSGSIQR
jgi:AcrR family transcriptional regulator